MPITLVKTGSRMTERTALRHGPLTSCPEDLDLPEEILSGKAGKSVLHDSSGIPLMSIRT